MHHNVPTNAAHDALIKEITGGQYLHGVGNSYPLPFATFTRDGATEVWACERGELVAIVATIRVGSPLPVSRAPMAVFDHMAERCYRLGLLGDERAVQNIQRAMRALR